MECVSPFGIFELKGIFYLHLHTECHKIIYPPPPTYVTSFMNGPLGDKPKATVRNCQKIANELMNTFQNLIFCDWKVTKFNMSWDFFVSLLLKCWMCQKQILSKKKTCVKMKVSMSNQTDVSITRIILKVDYFHLNQSLFNKCLSLFFALRVRTFFL